MSIIMIVAGMFMVRWTVCFVQAMRALSKAHKVNLRRIDDWNVRQPSPSLIDYDRLDNWMLASFDPTKWTINQMYPWLEEELQK